MTLLLLFCSLVVMGMYLMMKRIEDTKWLDYNEESFTFQSLVVVYFVFYILATILVVARMAV